MKMVSKSGLAPRWEILSIKYTFFTILDCKLGNAKRVSKHEVEEQYFFKSPPTMHASKSGTCGAKFGGYHRPKVSQLKPQRKRSEERRVGKECRSWCAPND